MEDLPTYGIRKNTIAFARSFVGSHYVKGGGGEVGGEGSLPMLPNVLPPPGVMDLPVDQRPEYHVLTAKNSYNRCSGRYGHKEVEKRPVGNADKPDHLASPDRYKWPRVVHFKYRNDLMGESCRGKYHFDCSGFVNYILKRTNSLVFNERLTITTIRSYCEVIDDTGVNTDDLSVCDILIRKKNGHIGLALGDDSGMVVQAEWESTGVVCNEVGNWEFHGRLPADFWNGLDIPPSIERKLKKKNKK